MLIVYSFGNGHPWFAIEGDKTFADDQVKILLDAYVPYIHIYCDETLDFYEKHYKDKSDIPEVAK